MQASGEGKVLLTAVHTKADGTQYVYEGEAVKNDEGDYTVVNWIRKVITDANSRRANQRG